MILLTHKGFIDLHKPFKCSGYMTDHKKEEVRSRVIGSVSSALVNLDSLYCKSLDLPYNCHISWASGKYYYLFAFDGHGSYSIRCSLSRLSHPYPPQLTSTPQITPKSYVLGSNILPVTQPLPPITDKINLKNTFSAQTNTQSQGSPRRGGRAGMTPWPIPLPCLHVLFMISFHPQRLAIASAG